MWNVIILINIIKTKLIWIWKLFKFFVCFTRKAVYFNIITESIYHRIFRLWILILNSKVKIASKSMTQASHKVKSAKNWRITFRSRTSQFQSVHWFPLVLKCYQRITLPTLAIPSQTKKSSQTKGNSFPEWEFPFCKTYHLCTAYNHMFIIWTARFTHHFHLNLKVV